MKAKCIDVGYWIGTLERDKEYDIERTFTNASGVKLYKLKGILQPMKVERFKLVDA